jgi:hypothetical protein
MAILPVTAATIAPTRVGVVTGVRFRPAGDDVLNAERVAGEKSLQLLEPPWGEEQELDVGDEEAAGREGDYEVSPKNELGVLV